jgi:hypothetical protein
MEFKQEADEVPCCGGNPPLWFCCTYGASSLFGLAGHAESLPFCSFLVRHLCHCHLDVILEASAWLVTILFTYIYVQYVGI